MKSQSLVVIIILCASVAGAVGYSVFSSSSPLKSTSTTDTTPVGMHRMPDGSLMGGKSDDAMSPDSDMPMMGGMDHSMMMVKNERDFIEGMIPHHEEAVATAKEVIARGGSTVEIKNLAEAIVTAQEKEIAMMKEWYKNWYGVAYTPVPEAYTPMMRDLERLDGAALDRVFLEDMIMHHMGAIMMARSVTPYIVHPEMSSLTNAIITSQTAEIELMRTLVAGL